MTVSRFTWYCGTELPGEIMAAALEDYRFEPHFHDAWSIGAIADGACAFSCLGAQWVARRGDVVVIAPRVVHTGGTAKAGLKYGMTYIDPAWFDQHAALVHRDGVGFEQIVIRDEALCEQWVAALTASELSSQERALALSTALLALLTRHGVPAAHAGDATRARERVRASRRQPRHEPVAHHRRDRPGERGAAPPAHGGHAREGRRDGHGAPLGRAPHDPRQALYPALRTAARCLAAQLAHRPREGLDDARCTARRYRRPNGLRRSGPFDAGLQTYSWKRARDASQSACARAGALTAGEPLADGPSRLPNE